MTSHQKTPLRCSKVHHTKIISVPVLHVSKFILTSVFFEYNELFVKLYINIICADMFHSYANVIFLLVNSNIIYQKLLICATILLTNFYAF